MSSWWNEPVPVRLSAGKTYSVTSPERAARILLTEWPGDPERPTHRAAREAVLSALEAAGDQKRALEARKAFAAAVEDAGVMGPQANTSDAEPVRTRWRRNTR